MWLYYYVYENRCSVVSDDVPHLRNRSFVRKKYDMLTIGGGEECLLSWPVTTAARNPLRRLSYLYTHTIAKEKKKSI